MARVLLIVPSSTYRAGAFVEAARSLGVEVVVGSEHAHALEATTGPSMLELPLGDPQAAAEAIVAHDATAPLDAVVAVDDQGTVAAAIASQRLGLAHNPPRAVEAARDKLLMRAMLDSAEVRQPVFGVVEAGAGPEAVRDLARDVGLPCVVKPTSLSASQGVLRADSPQEAWDVVRRVRAIARAAGVEPGSPLLLERFVPGPEVAVEGLLRGGEMQVLAVFDKPDPLDGPAFEESIYVTPSRLGPLDAEAVRETAAAASRALGLREGPVHAELRVSAAKATVIEIAARTIGGLCSRALSFSTGRTLEELVMLHALGAPADTARVDGRASGVLMLHIPSSGTFLGIEGRSRALEVPHVTDIELTVAPGRHVDPVPEGNRYLGFVFARARRPEDVERALRRAGNLIDVRIAPAALRAPATA